MEYETNQIYEDVMTGHGTTNSGLAEEDIYLSMDDCFRPTIPGNFSVKLQYILVLYL
jgi:1-aminocyclopropane-1-carboxylate deaminase/D-cysteine desulfhydrase-like pyridoxal-dependent ACC family enzyme